MNNSFLDDKKLSSVLKKMSMTNINAVEEVNIFKDDGTVIHILQPKSKKILISANFIFHCIYFIVQASIPSNTYVVSGATEVKRLEELLPGILTQLGPESMDYLRAYAESMGVGRPAPKAGGPSVETIKEGEEEDEDDEVPALVENFEEAAAK
jgi:nascent polypeptide-associated complex subunit beta